MHFLLIRCASSTRQDVLREIPGLAEALLELSGKFTNQTMQQPQLSGRPASPGDPSGGGVLGNKRIWTKNRLKLPQKIDQNRDVMFPVRSDFPIAEKAVFLNNAYLHLFSSGAPAAVQDYLFPAGQ